MQLDWSSSAPNHVEPEVIHTNRQDPLPEVLFEYEAMVTLPPEDDPAAPTPWLGSCPVLEAPAAEVATLTVVLFVDAPAVKSSEGSSNSRD